MRPPNELILDVLRLAPQKTALVIGDLILDEYVTGHVTRVSAEAPVPIVEFGSRSFVPGGAANVAGNLAASGCRAYLFGVVGADLEATYLRDAVVRKGVNADHVLTDASRPTTVKTRILAQSQQIVRLDREVRSPISNDLCRELLNRFDGMLASANVCILSDYGKGCIPGGLTQELIQRCKAANVPVLVDPKSLALADCIRATLVKPNKNEAERLVGSAIADDDRFLSAGQRLAESLPGSAVLVTRGVLGMTLFRNGREPYDVTTTVRHVFDVTGAGDTVISMCAIALACGASLEEAVELASSAAALAVGKLGTSTVSILEVHDAMTLHGTG